MTGAAPSLVWFRQDLRLADNPALHAAAEGPLLAVYVLDDAAHRHGGANRWWLHHSLAALAAALEAKGAALHLVHGDAVTEIPKLARAIGAQTVQAGRLYAPWARQRDAAVAEALEADGRKLVLHTSSVLLEPHRLRSGQGKPYAVYTPFARAIMAMGEPPPAIPAPDKLTGVKPPKGGASLASLKLLPHKPEPDWASGFPEMWTPGEEAAQARLAEFAADDAGDYAKGRDIPGIDGTSRLSPSLHWGEVSPRQVWHAVSERGQDAGRQTWLKEVLWREFSYHTLWHHPQLPEKPLRAEFEQFGWQPDAKLLAAWQRGQTGYPIVDAGMRQLWRHGWMHNRVRMITGSFLVKHLLQPWQEGAAWFLDTLVDGDLASNSQNWQWVSGCGVDAAPYFRIFNPILQGQKFDADGAYVREFVPELAQLPDKWLHQPWAAPEAVLREAGVVLGKSYPKPVVDHAGARARALAAFADLRSARE
ncbi:deoxyribodipyrimidine photo-lyase [Roseomonas sp. 18066]|uniref:cryptochrome/photolyase family protein n=1 Tax=Roseomonas sp. 18066 TaxID=2681412 RepID=UPI00135BD211|nr:deoxyribodipyrimidine photo-lyase [Roseomonas sp. 18066]